MKVPCRNCEDRHIGCHTTCSKYAAYRIAINARQRAKELDSMHSQLLHDRIVTAKKERKQGKSKW